MPARYEVIQRPEKGRFSWWVRDVKTGQPAITTKHKGLDVPVLFASKAAAEGAIAGRLERGDLPEE